MKTGGLRSNHITDAFLQKLPNREINKQPLPENKQTGRLWLFLNMTSNIFICKQQQYSTTFILIFYPAGQNWFWYHKCMGLWYKTTDFLSHSQCKSAFFLPRFWHLVPLRMKYYDKYKHWQTDFILAETRMACKVVFKRSLFFFFSCKNASYELGKEKIDASMREFAGLVNNSDTKMSC